MVYTTGEMESLKTDRSALKRKVSTLAGRVKQGITMNIDADTIVATFKDLQETFMDFATLDEEYRDAVEEDENHKENFDVVNGQNRQQYSAAVTEVYEDAKVKYGEFSVPHNKSVITEKIEEIRGKLIRVRSKVTKSLKDGEKVELLEDKISMEKVLIQIEDTQRRVKKVPDCNELSMTIDDMLEEVESSVRAISIELRRRSEHDEKKVEIIQPTISENSSESVSSVSLNTSGTVVASASSVSSGQTVSSASSSITPSSTSVGINTTVTASTNPVSSGQTGSVFSTSTSTTPNSASLSSTSSMSASGFPVITSDSMQRLPPMFAPMFPNLSQASGVPGQYFFPQVPGYPMTTASGQISGPPGTPLGSVSSQFGMPLAVAPEVKVKRLELPIFNGNRQSWPQFKILWPKLAGPAFKYDQETLAHQLEISLDGDAATLVSSVSRVGPKAFDNMWRRLTEFYDDSAATVRSVLKRLKNLKEVREEDYKSLSWFIDEVESCYSMLTSVDQLSCLSLMHADEVVELLPLSVKRDWNRIYHGLDEENKLHPFPSLMAFLIDERRMISRLVEQQDSGRRKEFKTSHQTSSFSNPVRKDEGVWPKYRVCAVHSQNEDNHTTAQCSTFQGLEPMQKVEALRSSNSCFRCFGNHKRYQCRVRDPCGKCGNTKHHTLLCRRGSQQFSETLQEGSQHLSGTPQEEGQHMSGTSQETVLEVPTVPTTSCSVHSKNLSLYATFTVPVAGSKHSAVVFTDDGSDSSYITDEAAKRLGARKLNKYLLEITTTGGKETEYESQEYELELLTRSGRKVTVNMYGLPKITGELAKLDLSAISKLFPQVEASSLQRQGTEVDILLGTDHFGLHPKNEVCVGGENLSVMEGALGMCLQGSHPDLKEQVILDTNFVKILKAANPVGLKKSSNLSVSVMHPILKEPEYGLGQGVFNVFCVLFKVFWSMLSVLTLNSLLSGGWLPSMGNVRRFLLVCQIIITVCFWKSRVKIVESGLGTDKWCVKDLQERDVVLVLDSGSVKVQYRLAVVREVFHGADGVTRKVKVSWFDQSTDSQVSS